MASARKILLTVAVVVVWCWILLFFYLRSPIVKGGAALSDAIQVDKNALVKHVHFLSSLSPPRQFRNQTSMSAAEDYIQRQLELLGFTVRRQDVFAFEKTYHNLIARYGDPAAKKLVVLGAHYDACGDQPGADDNASGIAGLLEIARLLKAQQPKLKTPIELVAYSLEEPPLFGGQEMGSAYHAQLLQSTGVEVKYMISLEMIGYFRHELFSQKFPFPFMYGLYPWRGDFIGIIGTPADRALVRSLKAAMIPNSGLDVVSINAPRFIAGVDFSDHRSYWNYDWPAVMITDTAFYRNEKYHSVGDTEDRLDFKSMAEVVRGVYAALIFTN